MAARDRLHNEAAQALQKDGWTITHDPYFVRFRSTFTEIDLGVESWICSRCYFGCNVLGFYSPNSRKYTEFAEA